MCSSGQMQKKSQSPLIETRCQTRVVAHAFLTSQTARKRQKSDKERARGMLHEQTIDHQRYCGARVRSYLFSCLWTNLPFIVVYRTLPLWSCCLKSHPQHRNGICPKAPLSARHLGSASIPISTGLFLELWEITTQSSIRASVLWGRSPTAQVTSVSHLGCCSKKRNELCCKRGMQVGVRRARGVGKKSSYLTGLERCRAECVS